MGVQKGMLAKVYLARSGWKGGTRDNADLEKAKELAADVINNSGISLYENYEDLFKYKHNNNPESLIAMQWVPLGDWGVCNTLLADLAGNSKMTGGVNVWSSYQASIDMLQQYELGDTIRRNATFCTPVHTIHTSALPTVVILTTAPPLALKKVYRAVRTTTTTVISSP